HRPDAARIVLATGFVQALIFEGPGHHGVINRIRNVSGTNHAFVVSSPEHKASTRTGPSPPAPVLAFAAPGGAGITG
ncbi:MAG: hypothetical protein ACOC7R_03400, partial [Planctomycetota bacterium]